MQLILQAVPLACRPAADVSCRMLLPPLYAAGAATPAAASAAASR
jgi:hypothetical protein